MTRMQLTFQSPSAGTLTLTEVITRIREYSGASDRHQHKVIIGTDSAPAISGRAEFVSAIVVHRVGNGGIYFWRREVKTGIKTLRDRMYHEALFSLDIARLLVSEGLQQPDQATRDLLEIHIDIGENGPTRQMIREIVGMVAGSGFTVRTKPHAYGASKVADRHT